MTERTPIRENYTPLQRNYSKEGREIIVFTESRLDFKHLFPPDFGIGKKNTQIYVLVPVRQTYWEDDRYLPG